MIHATIEYVYDNPKHLNDLGFGDRNVAVILKLCSNPGVHGVGLDREKLGTKCKEERGDLTGKLL